jgi:hypothetical protein
VRQNARRRAEAGGCSKTHGGRDGRRRETARPSPSPSASHSSTRRRPRRRSHFTIRSRVPSGTAATSRVDSCPTAWKSSSSPKTCADALRDTRRVQREHRSALAAWRATTSFAVELKHRSFGQRRRAIEPTRGPYRRMHSRAAPDARRERIPAVGSEGPAIADLSSGSFRIRAIAEARPGKATPCETFRAKGPFLRMQRASTNGRPNP